MEVLMQDIFIRRLIELMEENNLSQVDLSKLIGTTNVTICRYITGQRKPRIEIVAKMAEVLGTSIDYLLGFSNVKNFTNSKIDTNLHRIQKKLSSLGLLNSKNELSNSQIELIEKLLDANKEFIEQLKDTPKEA